jgi:hypothetical protein
MALVLATSGAAGAFTTTTSPKVAAPAQKVVRVAAASRFDWLANGRAAGTANAPRSATTVAYNGRMLGGGAYICSPAGFGQRSFCTER